jgi:site-specific DNA-adenine methylase
LNLALAHYREVSGALYDDAGAQVITRLWQTPAGLIDIKSWLFLGIGLVWSALALIDGVFYTDPFPGYAALERRVRKSHEDYIDCKTELIDRLRDIRDDASDLMQEAQNDLGKRRAEHTAILAGRTRIIQLFEEHQDQLERAGNTLLSKYRTANRQTRSSPPPSRFDEHWRMERSHAHSDLPDTLVRKDLDQEIKKAQDLLRREILAIQNAFEDAVETYRQIDDLIPEEPHAPTIKKSA